jgi:hypothetical protein
MKVLTSDTLVNDIVEFIISTIPALEYYRTRPSVTTVRLQNEWLLIEIDSPSVKNQFDILLFKETYPQYADFVIMNVPFGIMLKADMEGEMLNFKEYSITDIPKKTPVYGGQFSRDNIANGFLTIGFSDACVSELRKRNLSHKNRDVHRKLYQQIVYLSGGSLELFQTYDSYGSPFYKTLEYNVGFGVTTCGYTALPFDLEDQIVVVLSTIW